MLGGGICSTLCSIYGCKVKRHFCLQALLSVRTNEEAERRTNDGAGQSDGRAGGASFDATQFCHPDPHPKKNQQHNNNNTTHALLLLLGSGPDTPPRPSGSQAFTQPPEEKWHFPPGTREVFFFSAANCDELLFFSHLEAAVGGEDGRSYGLRWLDPGHR